MIGRTNAGLAPLRPKYSIKGWCATIGLAYADLSDITEPNMRLLMSKHVSVDYFMGWYNADNSMLDMFTVNEIAMKWIGQNDYIADKLLAISDAESRLLASEYWEYILKDHVPIMTSNTAPYGEVAVSNFHTSFPPYQAFDGDDSTMWRGSSDTSYNQSVSGYIEYAFPNPICVKRVKYVVPILGNAKPQTTDILFVGYNGAEEIPLTIASVNGDEYVLNDYVYIMKLRVTVTQKNLDTSIGARVMPAISTLQFYGRSLNVSVPTMTSNTQPYGEAYISYDIASYAPYYLFDKNDSTVGRTSNSGIDNVCFGYDFGKPMVCKGVRWKSADSSGTPRAKNIRVYGSNTDKYDKSNLLFTSTKVNLLDNLEFFENSEAYRYVFVCADRNINNAVVGFSTLDFFGVDYSDRTERTYLYDHGLEFAEIEEDKKNGTITKKSQSMLIECVSGTVGNQAVIGVRKDTTPYKRQFMNVGDSFVGGIFVVMSTISGGTNYGYKAWTSPLASPNMIYQDIENINENAYIAFNVNHSAITCKAEITEWWLE